MKFLITGGTGLIGKSIVQLLIEKNHHINVLSRKRGEDTKQVRYYQWSPKNQTIDFTCIDDVDVIINLAGENIFGLWTKSKKKKILESRVKSLQLLKKLIKNRPNNVKQIISASAIGIFPNSQEIIFDENSTQKGNTFLANVVKEWEREIESLKAFKINVTTVRIGMVFCELGGIIKVLRLISKSRFLSFIGNGDQKISWIHLNDLTELFYKISQKNYHGLIHAVNNNPTTMLDLITNLTNKYKLKVKLFIPALILKSFFRLLCLGDFYEDIANSNKNVVSKRINKVYPNLKYTSLKDL
ncbi:MAG: NAD-dependent epimerase [Flavobacteriaceae bacterium]|nr:MAG: NAD-dependent epimerase [Flavobacteriaceae bacterium]